MRDWNEAALLRSIAEEHHDNVPRLVLADWLDDCGESARAEFVRVQCELAAADLAAKRRQELRVRERDLLNVHRQEWLKEFGLPLEDVRFERGLIAGMRLAKWQNGKLLDEKHSPRLMTLTELDLSGLKIGDDGVALFADAAQMPALRKLILSDNDITDAGVLALANAQGLPRLDTLYLFGNTMGKGAATTLAQGERFRLASLDLGERPDGYCMSRGAAEMERRQYVREQMLPVVAKYFKTYKALQSALLSVAQYWADEADDAVHANLIVSELFEPIAEGVQWDADESAVDPNLPTMQIKSKHSRGSSSFISLWEEGANWDDNSRAIPLWAAYAAEGADQEYGWPYTPAVLFYRHGGYDFLPMQRPQLDGVRPEWGWEEEE